MVYFVAEIKEKVTERNALTKEIDKLHKMNQLKLLYPYCVFPFCYGMHSRDTTVLIDLL